MLILAYFWDMCYPVRSIYPLSFFMNFLLRNLFFLFVLLFLVIDGLFFLGNDIVSLDAGLLPKGLYDSIQAYAVYIPIIAITEIIILSVLAYYTSIKPIHSLKKEIAFFLTGSKQ